MPSALISNGIQNSPTSARKAADLSPRVDFRANRLFRGFERPFKLPAGVEIDSLFAKFVHPRVAISRCVQFGRNSRLIISLRRPPRGFGKGHSSRRIFDI